MKIPIVNEQDEIIKVIDHLERQKGDICRVSALWVTDRDGNILLAQRALNKKNSPGLWGPAVAGTVEDNETYELNITKEAGEEIGLFNIKLKKEYKVRDSTSHEYFAQWFTTIVDYKYPFKKQDDEVEKIQWFTKDQLLNFYRQNPSKFVSGFEYVINYFFNNK